MNGETNKVDRREFLKGALAGVAGTIVAGLELKHDFIAAIPEEYKDFANKIGINEKDLAFLAKTAFQEKGIITVETDTYVVVLSYEKSNDSIKIEGAKKTDNSNKI